MPIPGHGEVVLYLLLACGPDSAPEAALSVHADYGAGTTLTVTWETDTPADAVLELGEDESYGRTVEGWSSEDGLEHAVVVVGLRGGMTWHWRAVSEGAAGVARSADERFVPTPAPAALPDLQVEGEWDGMVLVPVLDGQTSYLTLYDGGGRAVWWTLVEGSEAPVNQARISLDGTAVIYLRPSTMSDARAELVRVPLAGGEREVIVVEEAHHDFVEVERGRYSVIASDQRMIDRTPVQGDALLDVTADAVTPIWSSWDDLPPPTDLLPEQVYNWTHLNSVSWDGTRWWLSSYSLESLLLVDPADGLVGVIGGEGGDHTLTAGEGFGPQHSPLPMEGGFLLFNNRHPDETGTFSEATAWSLDPTTRTYRREWTFRGDTPAYTPVFGSVEPTPDGDILTAWGTAGRLTLSTREGQTRWTAEAPIGYGFGFAHAVTWLSTAP